MRTKQLFALPGSGGEAQGLPTGQRLTAAPGRGVLALFMEQAVLPGRGGPRRRVQLCAGVHSRSLLSDDLHTLTAAPTSLVVVHLCPSAGTKLRRQGLYPSIGHIGNLSPGICILPLYTALQSASLLIHSSSCLIDSNSFEIPLLFTSDPQAHIHLPARSLVESVPSFNLSSFLFISVQMPTCTSDSHFSS